MSRSRRKTPIASVTCHGFRHGEKWWKRHAHKKLRQKIKVMLHQGIFSHFPTLKSISNPWYWPKDGKHWSDPDKYPEVMRK